MRHRLIRLLFPLPLLVTLTQCSQPEAPLEPVCWCVCSDERLPLCLRPQQESCPPSPVCASDDECDAYCQSDELCGERDPNYVECDLELDGYSPEVLCTEIPQCDGLSEQDCLERFTPFDCTFEWLFYRLCVAEEGCDSIRCGNYLQGWEDCKASQ